MPTGKQTLNSSRNKLQSKNFGWLMTPHLEIQNLEWASWLHYLRGLRIKTHSPWQICHSLWTWLAFRNTVKWWAVETKCHRSMGLGSVPGFLRQQQRETTYVTSASLAQMAFAHKASFLSFQGLSQLSIRGQSYTSIIHRCGETITPTKSNLLNKAFPKITSKGSRKCKRARWMGPWDGKEQGFIPQKAFDSFL